MNSPTQQRPWYREFWVWFMMALPASAVIAGISTVVIANTGADALVVDDFQKVGLIARKENARDREAERLHIGASASIDRASGDVVLRLAGDAQTDRIQLGLFHPTRRDLDRVVMLGRSEGNLYRGNIGANVTGHWYVQLADTTKAWRLSGRLADDSAMFHLGENE